MPQSIFDKLITGIQFVMLKGMAKYSSEIEVRLVEKKLSEAGITNVDSIHSYTEKDELIHLYYLASSCPPNSSALEVGSYLGASTCYLAVGLLQVKGHLYCVDTWKNETMPDGTRDTFTEFLMNTRNVNHMITPIRKRSCELSYADIRLPLNLIFIDGDHGYEVVKNDFKLVKSWLAEDGIIVFHDFGNNFEGVTRVLGEALSCGEWVMSGFVNTLAWIKPAGWSRLDRFSDQNVGNDS